MYIWGIGKLLKFIIIKKKQMYTKQKLDGNNFSYTSG